MQAKSPRLTPRSWTLRLGLALAVGLTLLPACARLELATPFRGPGYAKGQGVTLPHAGDTVVVALTNATLDPDTRRIFDHHTKLVIQSLPGNDGYIGHSVRSRVFGNEVWTVTVWRDQVSAEAFVRSPVHLEAIRAGMIAVKTARFHQFTLPANQVPPPWADIKARLAKVEPIRYRE